MAPPGMPKTTSACAASRDLTRLSAPVICSPIVSSPALDPIHALLNEKPSTPGWVGGSAPVTVCVSWRAWVLREFVLSWLPRENCNPSHPFCHGWVLIRTPHPKPFPPESGGFASLPPESPRN